MKRLIKLEWKRNRLRTYHIAAVSIFIFLLAMLFLFAAIPRLEPTDTDMGPFLTYTGITSLYNILGIASFAIFSSVLADRFVVEDFTGPQALLLFSYPISRSKILWAKLLLVFGYSVLANLLCGTTAFCLFFVSESLFPLSTASIRIEDMVTAFLSLLCSSIMAGGIGMIALWFGFRKRSISVTIIAAVILAVVCCQFLGMTLFLPYLFFSLLVPVLCCAFLAGKSLFRQIKKMEVSLHDRTRV